MKKLVLAASMLAASFGVFAQDYKPVAGNVTTELGLSLFGTGFQDQPSQVSKVISEIMA